MLDSDGYFAVEHQWNGKLNRVAFNNEESARTYAAKHHAVIIPLFKPNNFILDENEQSSSSSGPNHSTEPKNV